MLDSQTTLFLAALTFGLLPLLIWWLAPPEAVDDATPWWQLGSLAAAVGLGFLAWRQWLPFWIGAHGSNSLLLISLLLWTQSLRTSLGRGWRTQTVLWGCLLALGFYSLTYEALTPSYRIMTNRFVLGALALGVAHLAWQVARRDRSHNALAIMGCYLFLGGGLWYSVGLVAQSQLVFSATGVIQQVPGSPALLTLATATMGNFCYLGMMLDRALRRKSLAKKAQVVEQENASLDAKLQVMDRQRRLVLAAGSLSHELNQPLTAALTQTQLAQKLLLRPAPMADELSELLGKASASIWRTSDILNRIRHAAYSSEPPRALMDMRHVVRTACALMQPDCDEEGIDLRIDLSDWPLLCQGDEVLLSQVLVNLLRNSSQALKQAPLKRIELRASQVAGEVLVEVRDHGAGVPQRILARWGEPFVDSSDQGLGLGLAISLAIVHQYGGRLNMRNHLGGGAHATLRLPVPAEVSA